MGRAGGQSEVQEAPSAKDPSSRQKMSVTVKIRTSVYQTLEERFIAFISFYFILFHYLPTVILLLWYSFPHSLFHSRLKSFLFCESSLRQPFLCLLQDSLYGFPRLFTATSEHIRLFTF